MAKLTGSTKAQKSNTNADNDDRTKLDAAAASLDEAVAEALRDEAQPTGEAQETGGEQASTAVASSSPALAVFHGRVDDSSEREAFDTDAFASLGEGFGDQLKAGGAAIEQALQKWMPLVDNLGKARSELDRLRGVEIDRRRLDGLYAEEKSSAEKLRAELEEVKVRETAANERASKFEEICETIKERAFEIHTALQQARTNEQKTQAELTAVQSELTELKRVAQDEAAERVSLADRNAKLLATIEKLEADDAAARDRLAKIAEDNKAMATQVPRLLADRDNWQKQFSASERENARMQAERKVSGERIADLENEIRVLRSDLASLTSPQSGALDSGPQGAEDVVLGEDDLDLAASLDQAFSSDHPVAAADEKAANAK